MDADPFSVSCDTCLAQVGCSCVYVHPRYWKDQSRFGRLPLWRQNKVIAQAGTPLAYGKPHFTRKRKAEQQAQQAAQYEFQYEGDSTYGTKAHEQLESYIHAGRTLGEESLLFALYQSGHTAGHEEGFKAGYAIGVDESLDALMRRLHARQTNQA